MLRWPASCFPREPPMLIRLLRDRCALRTGQMVYGVLAPAHPPFGLPPLRCHLRFFTSSSSCRPARTRSQQGRHAAACAGSGASTLAGGGAGRSYLLGAGPVAPRNNRVGPRWHPIFAPPIPGPRVAARTQNCARILLKRPAYSCKRCPLPACTHRRPCPPLPPSAGTPPLCAAPMCKGPCLSKRNWSRLELKGTSVIPEPLWQTRHGMSTPARCCSTGEMGFSCECRKSMRPWRSKSTAVHMASRSQSSGEQQWWRAALLQPKATAAWWLSAPGARARSCGRDGLRAPVLPAAGWSRLITQDTTCSIRLWTALAAGR